LQIEDGGVLLLAGVLQLLTTQPLELALRRAA
jgi:hypothetical protein